MWWTRASRLLVARSSPPVARATSAPRLSPSSIRGDIAAGAPGVTGNRSVTVGALPSGSPHETPAIAHGDGLGPVRGLQLAEQPTSMSLDGVLGKEQLTPNLAVTAPT